MAGLTRKVAGAKKTSKRSTPSGEAKEPTPVEAVKAEIIRIIKSEDERRGSESNTDKISEAENEEPKDSENDNSDPTGQRDKNLDTESVVKIINRVMRSRAYTERGYKASVRSLEEFIADVVGSAPSNATLGNVLGGRIVQPPRSQQLIEIAAVIPNPQEFKYEALKKEGLLKLAQAFGSLFPDKNKKTEVDPKKLWGALTEIFENVLDGIIPEEGDSINPKNLWAIFAGLDELDEDWLESNYFEEAMEAIASNTEDREERLRKEAEEKRIKEEKLNREKRLKNLADLIRLDMKIRGCDEEEYGKDIVRLNQKILASFLDGSVEDDEVFNFRLSKFAGLLTNPETHQGFYSADELWQYCDR